MQNHLQYKHILLLRYTFLAALLSFVLVAILLQINKNSNQYSRKTLPDIIKLITDLHSMQKNLVQANQ